MTPSCAGGLSRTANGEHALRCPRKFREEPDCIVFLRQLFQPVVSDAYVAVRLKVHRIETADVAQDRDVRPGHPNRGIVGQTLSNGPAQESSGSTG